MEPASPIRCKKSSMSSMSSRTAVVVGAMAGLLLVAGCGGAIEAGDSDDVPVSIEAGTWRTLPVAPISFRAHTVSGWSGSEALFWAGSNLERGFAHTDGAAYDPATDTWRKLRVPGWGHPGLAGAVFDDRLFVAAKGGLLLIDPADGSDDGLPPAPGFVPGTVVATDTAVWSLGPTDFDGSGRVGIARYDMVTGGWVAGSIFEGTPEMQGLLDFGLFVEESVVWTGSEIVVWSGTGRGLAYDPSASTWRVLPQLAPAEGTLNAAEAAATNSGLAVLTTTDIGGRASVGVAVLDGESWSWHDTDLEGIDFETVTIAAAGDWLLVFGPDHPPYSVHVTTGESVGHDDGPLAGIEAPNTVWTGDELVIWGGVPTQYEDEPIVGGAVWTPPSG